MPLGSSAVTESLSKANEDAGVLLTQKHSTISAPRAGNEQAQRAFHLFCEPEKRIGSS